MDVTQNMRTNLKAYHSASWSVGDKQNELEEWSPRLIFAQASRSAGEQLKSILVSLDRQTG